MPYGGCNERRRQLRYPPGVDTSIETCTICSMLRPCSGSPREDSFESQVAAGQKVQVLEMQRHPKVAGLFSLQLHKQSPISLERRLPNAEKQSGRDDIALVLHTSGTTKKPKIATSLQFVGWCGWPIADLVGS